MPACRTVASASVSLFSVSGTPAPRAFGGGVEERAFGCRMAGWSLPMTVPKESGRAEAPSCVSEDDAADDAALLRFALRALERGPARLRTRVVSAMLFPPPALDQFQ